MRSRNYHKNFAQIVAVITKSMMFHQSKTKMIFLNDLFQNLIVTDIEIPASTVLLRALTTNFVTIVKFLIFDLCWSLLKFFLYAVGDNFLYPVLNNFPVLKH